MGMCAVLRTLGDDNIRRVLADPPLVWKVVAPDDPDAYAEARGRPGLLARLFGRQRQSGAETPFELRGHEGAEADLDKAWHGIHYLLTGAAWDGAAPLAFLVNGGAQIGELEVGYGPARAFTAAEVRALRAALEPIDADTLRSRFDPATMMELEIYPEIWDRDPADDDTFGYCADYFADMKQFIASAADQDMGLIVYLS